MTFTVEVLNLIKGLHLDRTAKLITVRTIVIKYEPDFSQSTHVRFGDDRLKGSGFVAGSKFSISH